MSDRDDADSAAPPNAAQMPRVAVADGGFRRAFPTNFRASALSDVQPRQCDAGEVLRSFDVTEAGLAKRGKQVGERLEMPQALAPARRRCIDLSDDGQRIAQEYRILQTEVARDLCRQDQRAPF